MQFACKNLCINKYLTQINYLHFPWTFIKWNDIKLQLLEHISKSEIGRRCEESSSFLLHFVTELGQLLLIKKRRQKLKILSDQRLFRWNQDNIFFKGLLDFYWIPKIPKSTGYRIISFKCVRLANYKGSWKEISWFQNIFHKILHQWVWPTLLFWKSSHFLLNGSTFLQGSGAEGKSKYWKLYLLASELHLIKGKICQQKIDFDINASTTYKSVIFLIFTNSCNELKRRLTQ